MRFWASSKFCWIFNVDDVKIWLDPFEHLLVGKKKRGPCSFSSVWNMS